MGYIVKGGVWKNSEDEILKAAVMKYGLNQWSRISSLLVRKSAKQCKQRWYEWLDPSIKKMEWTKEEDEKLLHLSKIFPTQWRTIAPIVGRTPTQCVERYDKLLDMAQGKDLNDPNDPRKLKPGEIDPNPESKAPRLDPLNMDEDEKEMLAEARVRLANTKGKKAKRIAREKMIEEARRLATLQKRRELKAAGIEFTRKKRIKGIDFNSEIPFERPVPDYVFSTDKSETPAPNLKFQSMSYNSVEGKFRDEEDRRFKEIDKKRMKKLMENDMESVAEKLAKEQEKLFANKTKLVLPSPQMQDQDLEMLGKMNQLQDASEIQNQATKALVGDYTQRGVQQTPMVTPMMQNSVMREAHNLIALQQTQTPLVGGENQALDQWEKVKGLAPTPSLVSQTPNHLKMQLGQQSFMVPSTQRGGLTPSLAGQTPMRDNFKINMDQSGYNWEEQSQVSGLSEEKLQALRYKDQQAKIKDQLFALPKPKHEYQIQIPELEEEENEEQKRIDQEEEDRKKYEQQVLEMQKKMRMRSLAIQKNLPRPYSVPSLIYDHIYKKEELPFQRQQASQMIETEMLNLLQFDGQNFPFQGVKPINFEVALDNFEEIDIIKASKLLQKEIQNIKDELRHGNIDKEFIQSKWDDAYNQIMYSKEEQKVFDLRETNKKQEQSLLLESLNSKRELFFRESKKLEAMDAKIQKLTAGYKKIIGNVTDEISGMIDEQNNQKLQKAVYEELKMQEERSVLPRLDELRQYYARLEGKYANLQEKYEQLLIEKQELVEDQGYFN